MYNRSTQYKVSKIRFLLAYSFAQLLKIIINIMFCAKVNITSGEYNFVYYLKWLISTSKTPILKNEGSYLIKIPYSCDISIASCFINPSYLCYHYCRMNTPLRIRFTWWFWEYAITQYRGGDLLFLRCKLRQINQNDDLERIYDVLDRSVYMKMISCMCA